MKHLAFLFLLTLTNYAYAKVLPAVTAPIPLREINGYAAYPPTVQALIQAAQHLSEKNLTYLYGSANPANGGMDCSGTIYYLLTQQQVKNVPRSSDDIFHWAEREGKLHRVSASPTSIELSQLKPGDLLFWSGTYQTQQAQNISHTMIYLGKNKDGKPLMFGSSDGRTYQGKRMWGVGVFDFNLPQGKGPQRFEGYSCIPHLTCQDP